MRTERFEVPTQDGRSVIRGQIDFPAFPESGRRHCPLLVIVPGSVPMDRDGHLGNTGAESDLVYRQLAKRGVASGMAVLRYDNRGVCCNEMTMPDRDDQLDDFERTKRWIDDCVDLELRTGVTPTTILDDAEGIYRYGAEHPHVDRDRIVALCHSEGGLTMSRLVAQKRATPRAIITIGTAVESPIDTLRWQMVDRYTDRLLSWGTATGTSGDDVREHFARDPFFAGAYTQQELLPPEAPWTRESARRFFHSKYEEARLEAEQTPDLEPYPKPSPDDGLAFVIASYAWWKQWFVDGTDLVQLLAGYAGPMSFHFGEIDCQCPGPRQSRYLDRHGGRLANVPRIKVHAGRGHCLRTGEEVYGPMDDEAATELIAEACAFALR